MAHRRVTTDTRGDGGRGNRFRTKGGISFYLTCESGLQSAVSRFICEALPGCAITRTLDGAVEFTVREIAVTSHAQSSDSSSPSPRNGIPFPFGKNVFLVLLSRDINGSATFGTDAAQSFRELTASPHEGTAGRKGRVAEYLNTTIAWAQAIGLLPKESMRTCRVMAYDGNDPTGIPESVRTEAERYLQNALGLRTDRHRPHTELWLYRRSEGIFYVLLRLTGRRAVEEDLAPGELKPELCNTVCRLTKPAQDDVFLDPFCGSGAIPLERARMVPYRYIFASDADPRKVTPLRRRTRRSHDRKTNSAFFTKIADAGGLEYLSDGFVTAVATDPPWGEFTDVPDLPGLYRSFLDELTRVLAPGGRAVVLTGRDSPLDTIIGDLPTLEPSETFQILVSGKKASIHVLFKR